jgi:hypothetical protein
MLLLACVADRVKGDRFSLLRRVVPIASGGYGNVRRKLREDGDALASRGPLVAMLDNDKIRVLYGLAQSAPPAEVERVILAEAQDSPTIVLLIENMEDLVAACCAALKRPIPAKKPAPEERDKHLQAAANDSDLIRAQVLDTVPSFKALVDVVERLLSVARG